MVNFVRSEIASNFVREEIKKTHWKDRWYITCLKLLEDLVLGRVGGGYATGLYVHNLIQRYSAQYHAIFKELKPKEYEELLEREKQKEKYLKVDETAEKRRKKRQQKEEQKKWKALGGLTGQKSVQPHPTAQLLSLLEKE